STGEQEVVVLLGGGGGGGTSNLTALWAIVTEEIGPASGDTSEVTPAEGAIGFYSTNAETGVRTIIAEEQESPCVSYDTEETYEVGTPVYVTVAYTRDIEGGTEDVYEVISASCGTYDEGS